MLLFARRERPATWQDRGHRSGSPREPNEKSIVSNDSPLRPIVFIVDDDVSVRESLELLIQDAGWQPETFASATSFLGRPRVRVPSCLLLDVSLPDLNGLDLQQRIADDRADMPIIFITGYGDVPMTVRAMKLGAVDFLSKPFQEHELLAAIETALERDRTARQERAALLELQAKLDSLSARERDVLPLVVSGLMNKQGAAKLGISEITFQIHRGNMMRKMHAGSLAELVRIAGKLNIPITHSRHGN